MIRPYLPKLVRLVQETFTRYTFSSLVYCLLPTDNFFLRTYLTTTCGWDCVATLKHFSALHYNVILSCPLVSWMPLWKFETIRASLMRSNWSKLTSLAQKTCTLYTFSSLVYFLRTYSTILLNEIHYYCKILSKSFYFIQAK